MRRLQTPNQALQQTAGACRLSGVRSSLGPPPLLSWVVRRQKPRAQFAPGGKRAGSVRQPIAVRFGRRYAAAVARSRTGQRAVPVIGRAGARSKSKFGGGQDPDRNGPGRCASSARAKSWCVPPGWMRRCSAGDRAGHRHRTAAAEPVAAADRRGMVGFPVAQSPQPRRLLSWVVRRRRSPRTDRADPLCGLPPGAAVVRSSGAGAAVQGQRRRGSRAPTAAPN